MEKYLCKRNPAEEPGGLSPFSLVLEAEQHSGSECKLWSQPGMGLKLGSMTYKIYDLII